MFIHTCEICGKEFESRSNRAKYYKNCRDKAQVLRNKAYMEKKNPEHPLQSEVSRFARFAVTFTR